MANIEGFPPIAEKSARVLVLGSMPSEASLKKQQYYGHPRNAFWFIMGELFGACPDKEYQQRKAILIEQDVAVWDVMKTCYRKGSLDADIDEASIFTNDFASFFTAHPSIRHVFFNGGAAERIYKKYILTTLGDQYDYIQYDRLPSTSPAHASISLEDKAGAWKLISDVLNS